MLNCWFGVDMWPVNVFMKLNQILLLNNILTQKPDTWTLLLYSCLDSHAYILLAKNYTGCTDSLTTGKTKTRARNRRLELCLLWTFWSLWFSYSSQALPSVSLSKSHVFQLNIPSDTLSLPCLQSRFQALRFSPAQTLLSFSSKRLTTAPLSSRATTAQALSPAIVLGSTHAIPVRRNVASKGQLEKRKANERDDKGVTCVKFTLSPWAEERTCSRTADGQSNPNSEFQRPSTGGVG